MHWLTLPAALALPWAVGALWLRTLSPAQSLHAASVARQLGYGFFIGMALTALLLSLAGRAFGELESWPVILSLSVLLLIGLVLLWRRRDFVPAEQPELVPQPEGWERGLLLLLGLLVAVHLLFTLTEILVRPLFPWDAWTVWVYRAKAWFLSGRLFEFVGPTQWAAASGDLVYTQPALRYPLLVSLVYLWAAEGLGEWHEALVSLPVFFCGLAIALAFWGQARAGGIGRVPAAVWSYFLLSTPLLATHWSLAGYADLWMAGFAGLGFLALISAAAGGPRQGWWLGLLLLGLATQVKVEGLVWLLAGLLWWVLARGSARLLFTVAFTALVLLALGWITGVTSLTVPGLGEIGLRGRAVVLPGYGIVTTLGVNDVTQAYFRNAFASGTWHLAWLLVAIFLIAGLLARPGSAGHGKGHGVDPPAGSAATRASISFLLVFAAVQVAIFVFSAEGAWARDATAINRLPLQVYPAVLFSLALLARAAGAGFARRRAGVEKPVGIGRPAGIALVIVIFGLLFWLRPGWEGQPPESVNLSPGGLEFVIGGGRESAGGLVLDRYQDGVILLSSGPVAIDSERLTLLRLELDVDPSPLQDLSRAPAFFWRRAGDEERVSRHTIVRDGFIDLRTYDEWRGTISEVGFLFIEGTPPPVLHSAELVPRDLSVALRRLPGEWFSFEPWTQRSANALDGGAPVQSAPLPLLATAWVLVTLLLTALASILGGRAPPTARAVGLLLLCAWLLLDLRWLSNRARQFTISLAQAGQSVEERITATELGRHYPWIARVRDELLDRPASRVLLVRDRRQLEYYSLRSKYQLLPHSVLVRSHRPGAGILRNVDYVLFLGTFMDNEDPRRIGVLRDRLQALSLPPPLVDRLELVDFSESGMLFRVR